MKTEFALLELCGKEFPYNVLFIEQIVFAPRLSNQILLEIEYHVFFFIE